MFEQILDDFNKGNIRGPEDIAKWGLRALESKKQELDEKCSFISTYLANLKKAKKIIIGCSNTQIILKNVLDYVVDFENLRQLQTLEEIKRSLSRKIKIMGKRLEKAPHKLSLAGHRKLKNVKSVLTHGYSKSVLNILEESRKRKLKISVISAEPFGEGELMAKDVSKLFPTLLFLDSGVDAAIKSSNIVLIGCNSYDERGFVCYAGTESLVLTANFYGVPVYVCTDTLRYSEFKLLKKNTYTKKLKRIKVINSIVGTKLIKGVICEEGVLSTNEFLKKSKSNY